MRDVVGLILGGGQGTRLFPLTQFRAKPAVPVGGKYRLIDIPISNCIHSGINRIFVLTQFNSASLHRHISTSYRFDSFSDGFVEILAAEQTQENSEWYQGTADAVRQQLRHLLSHRTEQVLILSGDHLYRMDYQAFIEDHRKRAAEVSIAVKPVKREEASALGIVQMDPKGRIVNFCEKPQQEADLDALRLSDPTGADPEEVYMSSMGIYIFEPQVLVSLLMGSAEDDFGKHIIPEAIEKVGVYAHTFEGYWEDIGTIRSFYEANLALTDSQPPFDFYRSNPPIYTHPRFLAGTRLEDCRIKCGIVCEGSYIHNAYIEHSVIGIRSVIGTGCRISNTIIMGADFDETPTDLDRNIAKGVPNIGIGTNSTIDGAIIDKNARIGSEVTIANREGIREADGENYYIRDGIVVIPKDAVIQSKTEI